MSYCVNFRPAPAQFYRRMAFWEAIGWDLAGTHSEFAYEACVETGCSGERELPADAEEAKGSRRGKWRSDSRPILQGNVKTCYCSAA
jgi:hypothetical protein